MLLTNHHLKLKLSSSGLRRDQEAIAQWVLGSSVPLASGLFHFTQQASVGDQMDSWRIRASSGKYREPLVLSGPAAPDRVTNLQHLAQCRAAGGPGSSTRQQKARSRFCDFPRMFFGTSEPLTHSTLTFYGLNYIFHHFWYGNLFHKGWIPWAT